MKHTATKIILNILYPVAAVAVMLCTWWIAAAVKGNELILPTPSQTVNALGTMLVGRAFWRAFGGTLLRTVIAFAVSLAVATVLAVAARLWTPVRRFLAPVVSVLRALPTVAVVLLLVVWSSPRVAPVIVDALVIMPVLQAAILAAIDGVDPDLIEMSRVYRVPLARKLCSLYLPSIVPAVMPQIASTLSLSVKLMVASEVLAATAHSLGGQMQQMAAYWETAKLFAYTLVAVIVSLVLEYGVLLVFRLCTKRRRAV